MEEARQLKDIDEKHKALRAVASKHPAGLTAFLVQQILLADLVQRKASALAFARVIADYRKKETKEVAEDLAPLAVAFVIAFGDSEEAKLRSTVQIATVLLESSSDPVGELGLVYARMAVEQLKSTTPTPQRVAIYAILLRGARKHGKPEEVAKTQALLDFFEGQLDETYRKEAIPFPVEKASPRKSKSAHRSRGAVHDGGGPALHCR